MAETLLSTKLYIPAPSQTLVHRPRLMAVLAKSLSRKLTLVSAPPGYGKTTLVSSWLSELEMPVMWMALDEGDNDPVRFLQYFLMSLQKMAPTVQLEWMSAVKGGQSAPYDALLNIVINEIAEYKAPAALVLDDFHVIDAQPVLDLLAYFLEHMPPQLHLFMLTRSDPPLALSRLRVRDQLVEIRADQLRFTRAEIDAFLVQVMGLELMEDDLLRLERRTEGWVAGLQLAAVSMQGKDAHQFVSAFTGSQAYIMDYLAEEVLNFQPEEVRSFLLKSSILERLCGSLCEEVVQAGMDLSLDGQAMLETLEGLNLFIIPMDNEKHWYRYHHLFADVLNRHLERRYPQLLPELHRRASHWLEQNGYIYDSIQHALQAGDRERAAQLVDRYGCELLMRGEVINLLKWIEAVQPEAGPYPWIAIQKGWSLCITGQLEGVEEVFQAAEKLISVREPSDEAATMSGTVLAARAFRALRLGETAAGASLARQSLAGLPASNDFSCSLRSAATSILGDASWMEGNLLEARRAYIDAVKIGQVAANIPMQIIASVNLAEITLELGQLHQAARIYADTLKAAELPEGKTSPLADRIYAGLSRIYYEWNQPENALKYAQQCMDLSRRWGNVAAQAMGLLSLAELALLQGNLQAAQASMHATEQLVRDSQLSPWLMSWSMSTIARLWMALGSPEKAAGILQKSGIVVDRIPKPEEISFLQEGLYVVQARLLLSQGDAEAALALTRPLLQRAEARSQLRRTVEVLVLRALACQHKKEPDKALEALDRALSLAQEEGYTRLFLDEGKAMAQLLYQARAQRLGSGYAAELLAQIDRAPGAAPPPVQLLIEPLTSRELEVLKLIEAGCSNQEIAAQLFISLPTVKRHISNIYSKLEVESRTQAVARGKELKVFE